MMAATPFITLLMLAIAVSNSHAAESSSAPTVKANNVTLATRACLPPHNSYAFCDVSLDIDTRVKDLISRLEAEEKPPLLTAREGGGGSPGPPGNVSRIGLPEYDWGMNAIHGVQSTCVEDEDGKVNFGFTWNKTAFYLLGSVIGIEARALWLAGAEEYSQWSGRPHIGLDSWSPNINIARSPLWGRNQEVPSEDPYLNGQFGKLYTQGIQEGQDDRYLQLNQTDWDAYSLEDSDGATRHNFNAVVSNFSLQDTYWPAFKEAVVNGKAAGVMCSYNAVNGIPTCAHPLLNYMLREQWKFEGYVTSDTGAVDDIYSQHKYVPSAEEAACIAIKQGKCDIDSGSVYHDALLDGVSHQYCSMDDVDAALQNTLRLRFRLGLFDPVDDQPYWKVPLSAINTTQAQKDNLQITLESMVLLKNTGNTLPLRTDAKVAIIGPHAKAQSAMAGNYLGQICPEDGFDCVASPFDAISNIVGTSNVLYSAGSGIESGTTDQLNDAVATAKQADQIVLMLGIDESVEAESHDRTSIDLPGCQHNLSAAVLALGKPTVIVLLNGGMLAIEPEKESAPAIIEAGYPGIFGGIAIAKTLFGQNDHLGGKLSYTIYPADYITKIKMSDMEMTSGPGRTYRYYQGEPLWPFGYGLSLTTFNLSLSTTPGAVKFQTGDTSASYRYDITVTNTGSRTGDEVVQLYMSPTNISRVHPLKKQLIGFERVHLDASTSATVSFFVDISKFNLVATESGNIVSTPGEYTLQFSNGVDQLLEAKAELEGPEVVVEYFPQI